jgi:hypothetical protein
MQSRTVTPAGPTADAATAPRALRFTQYVLRITNSAWLSAGLIFLFTRLVALAGAYSGISRLIAAEPARDKGWLAELALMWDAAWYAGIASDGYHYDPAAPGGTNVAFAPLYPFLMRTLASVLRVVTFGWDWGNEQWGALIAAGLIISNVATYLALVLLIRLLAPRLGTPSAVLVALGVAAFPTAFFLSGLYTEGLFLFLVLASFSLARSDWPHKWLCASLIGMLASLDRFAGLLLLPVLATEYFLQSRRSSRSNQSPIPNPQSPQPRLQNPLPQAGPVSKIQNPQFLWLALIPIGTAIYAGYLWLRFGSPFALNDSMLKGWNHQGSFFLVTYWESLSQLWLSLTGAFPAGQDPVLYYGNGSRLYLFLDLALPVLLLIGAFVARRYLLASEWVWLVLGIIYPLSTNITFSLARYVLPLWPGLIWLGITKGRARLLSWAWIAASLLLMAWCARIYASARWIG